MPEHKILYTSDIHGNKRQYKTFMDYAMQIKPATVIIGGDIAPKDTRLDAGNSEYIDAQRNFLVKDLPTLIRPLKQCSPKTNVFVMMGNDDCAVNIDVLNSHPELYRDIHGKRFRLDEKYEIIGYPFVPITPFCIKDFEKFDLSEIPGWARHDYEARMANCRFDGLRSVDEPSLGWMKYRFGYQEILDSIQRDLDAELFTATPKETVYVFHTPPNNTSLDVIGNNAHAGSFAVRSFIVWNKPRLTLHGHIHETVDITGRFMDAIGESVLISAGNHNYGSSIAIVEFDLYNLKSAQRKKLSEK